MTIPSLIRLIRPDDWHLHLRDGAAMADVVRHSARQFGRAVIMPNLRPPVTRVKEALAYRQRILANCLPDSDFNPLMTLYMTDQTSIEEIREAAENPHLLGLKLYPAGATTNSDAGVTALEDRYPLFEEMERLGVPLLVHGEVTHPEVDVFDREKVFIEQYLAPMSERFPGLRIVLEHITTADGAEFVEHARDGIAATITAHHLLVSRNAMLAGGIRPHLYCLPILKREHHRKALLRVATSKNPRFFLGTDSAPHSLSQKQSSCGCAGCYTALTAIELYATAFEQAGALDALESFASLHGPLFYGLPPNPSQISLERKNQTIPAELPFGAETVIPFMANSTINWTLVAS